jgi:hypothetical protein
MAHKIRQCVIGGFALWLVALSGIVYPQLTAHMGQHEHHNAATHATALCSWLCIAADAVEGTRIDLTPVQYVTVLEQALPVTELHSSYTSQPPSRAPPLV